MKTILIEDNVYEVIVDNREAFNEEEFKNKCTDYFYDYDYILGDIAYNKVRLKGFYDEKNKKANGINNYKNKDKYLKDNCAVNCRYFVVKKQPKDHK